MVIRKITPALTLVFASLAPAAGVQAYPRTVEVATAAPDGKVSKPPAMPSATGFRIERIAGSVAGAVIVALLVGGGVRWIRRRRRRDE